MNDPIHPTDDNAQSSSESPRMLISGKKKRGETGRDWVSIALAGLILIAALFFCTAGVRVVNFQRAYCAVTDSCPKPTPIIITTTPRPVQQSATKPPTQRPQITSNPATGAVIFTSIDDFGPHLYIMNIDGTNVQRVPGQDDSKQYYDGVWSPDGQRVAFTSNHDRPYGNVCINLMNLDGSDIQLLNDPCTLAERSPIWSPDGRQIAFLGNPPSTGVKNIYVTDLDTRITRQLTTYASSVTSAATWSPDGKQIAYVKADAADTRSGGMWLNLYVMNADGSNQHTIIENGSANYPMWSPDGTKIAYVNNAQVYVVNVDGTDIRQVTKLNLWNGTQGLDWSPDGQSIILVASTPSTQKHVFRIVGLDGQIIEELPVGPRGWGGLVGFPSWLR